MKRKKENGERYGGVLPQARPEMRPLHVVRVGVRVRVRHRWLQCLTYGIYILVVSKANMHDTRMNVYHFTGCYLQLQVLNW